MFQTISLLAAAAFAWTQSPGGGSESAHTVFSEPERNVSVRYDVTPAGVEFSSRLPAGWTFSVSVDSDQDGKWGIGPYAGDGNIRLRADRSFGTEADTRRFCAQYVLASVPDDPDNVYMSTNCSRHPGAGQATLSPPDDQGWVTTRLRIPLEDLFGSRPDAHLRACVWDTHRWSCQHSPAQPYVLRRPGALPG